MNTLHQRYDGQLLVIIHTLSGLTEHFQCGIKDSTLFEYVGHACACIFTNMTTRLSVSTCEKDWRIIKFEPKEGVLEVRQVSGPNLEFEPDEGQRLIELASCE